MDQVVKAFNFAAIAHRKQKRKDNDGTPYINHPIEVAHLLSLGGVTDPDILSAAVLHDTIEDCGVTFEQLKTEFNTRVAELVMECSDDKSLSKVNRKKAQIEHTKHISVGAKMIKAADKLSNLSTLDSAPPVGWSKEIIEGSYVWSYAVCCGLFGHNEFLDEHLQKIFASQKLIGITTSELNERLEKYYDSIRNAN